MAHISPIQISPATGTPPAALSKSDQGRAADNAPTTTTEQKAQDQEVREAFGKFFGTTFYGQMLKAMRSTIKEPAYFHGGRAEEVFQEQLDQKLADYMTEATGEQLAQPMFDLFMLQRS